MFKAALDIRDMQRERRVTSPVANAHLAAHPACRARSFGPKASSEIKILFAKLNL